MNKDRIKGTAKVAVGKAQEKTGKLTGNRTQQVKGLAKQAAGKLQRGVGRVRDDVEAERRRREREEE